jgi:hypothetical protein
MVHNNVTFPFFFTSRKRAPLRHSYAAPPQPMGVVMKILLRCVRIFALCIDASISARGRKFAAAAAFYLPLIALPLSFAVCLIDSCWLSCTADAEEGLDAGRAHTPHTRWANPDALQLAIGPGMIEFRTTTLTIVALIIVVDLWATNETKIEFWFQISTELRWSAFVVVNVAFYEV